MKRSTFTLLLITITFLSISIESAHSIPAFARKYRMSCVTCHSPVAPSLKDYGDEFAGNGFVLSDQEARGYYVETGDEELSLIRNFPIAIRMDGFITYNINNEEKPDFAAPYLMKLMSGGAIGDHLAYYFYFYLSERGEVVGVEDAFLIYNNLFDSELDIYLGQFQVSDPLFKRELRLELEDYHAYTVKIGMSDIQLKYDKGVMLTYGFKTGTDVIVEVLNGDGIGAAENHVFDKDKYKNFAGRISQNIGDNFRIGGFILSGKETLTNFEDNSVTNESMIFGPDFTLAFGNKLAVNGQYLLRNDSRVFSDFDSSIELTDIRTDAILGEIVYSPKGDESNWYFAGLYNWVDSEFNPADYHSVTVHSGYLLRRNVRLVGEYTNVFTDTDNPYSLFSVGFVSAF